MLVLSFEGNAEVPGLPAPKNPIPGWHNLLESLVPEDGLEPSRVQVPRDFKSDKKKKQPIISRSYQDAHCLKVSKKHYNSREGPAKFTHDFMMI